MLKVVKRNFTCPHCQNTFEITERVAINVTMDPGLKNKVLKGKIFRHICPQCQTESIVLNNCMYHDLEKQFIVYLMIDTDQREYCIPIGADGLGDFGDRYVLRLEVDYNGFRERVRILDMGFDDIVFEMTRYLILKELKKKMPEAEELYFIGMPKGDLCFQVIVKGSAVRNLDVTLEMYDQIKKEYEKFPEAHQKVNALRRIDAQWLEETGLISRIEKIYA